MYYVIECLSKKEDYLISLIKDWIPKDVCVDAFIPKRDRYRKNKGIGHVVREILFPGYVFVETSDVRKLVTHLMQLPLYARMLGKSQVMCDTGPTYLALSDSEAMIIDALCEKKNNRVATISKVTIKKGQIVTVIEGPLLGLDGEIVKVDLHRNQVQVKINMFSRWHIIKLGIDAIMDKDLF